MRPEALRQQGFFFVFSGAETRPLSQWEKLLFLKFEKDKSQSLIIIFF